MLLYYFNEDKPSTSRSRYAVGPGDADVTAVCAVSGSSGAYATDGGAFAADLSAFAFAFNEIAGLYLMR
ncbi:MAG TPA: hypothetical protein VE130_09290 [Nitrososphaeraceae archaeon]|nr:hypothetical protein [Nitrososphaeraceae archaeon]